MRIADLADSGAGALLARLKAGQMPCLIADRSCEVSRWRVVGDEIHCHPADELESEIILNFIATERPC